MENWDISNRMTSLEDVQKQAREPNFILFNKLMSRLKPGFLICEHVEGKTEWPHFCSFGSGIWAPPRTIDRNMQSYTWHLPKSRWKSWGQKKRMKEICPLLYWMWCCWIWGDLPMRPLETCPKQGPWKHLHLKPEEFETCLTVRFTQRPEGDTIHFANAPRMLRKKIVAATRETIL